MNIQLLHDDVDITQYLIDYQREQHICSGVGLFQCSLGLNYSTKIDPWDEFILYENGIKKGTYLVSATEQQVPESIIKVNCQDYSKKLVDYFIVDSYYIDYLSYTKTWIKKFLKEAGVNYEINASGNGSPLSNNTNLGLNSAWDTIQTLLQYSGWYLYFDPNGKAIIDVLTLDADNYDHLITDDIILDIYDQKDDKLLRNRAVVWGGANPYSGEWIFTDKSVNTPWNYDKNDKRAVVLANGNVRESYEAEKLAKKMLDTFSVIYTKSTYNLSEDLNIQLGDVVAVKSKHGHTMEYVTSVGSTMSREGLIEAFTIGERCPRLFGYWSWYPPYPEPGPSVYVGTNNSGIWRRPINTSTWVDFSSGLDGRYVYDLDINKSVAACMTAELTSTGNNKNGIIFAALTYGSWYQPLPNEFLDESDPTGETIYTLEDVEARGCSIDKDTNEIYAIYNLKDGIQPNGEDRSWMLTFPYGGGYNYNQIIDSGSWQFNVRSFDISAESGTPYLSVGTTTSGAGGIIVPSGDDGIFGSFTKQLYQDSTGRGYSYNTTTSGFVSLPIGNDPGDDLQTSLFVSRTEGTTSLRVRAQPLIYNDENSYGYYYILIQTSSANAIKRVEFDNNTGSWITTNVWNISGTYDTTYGLITRAFHKISDIKFSAISFELTGSFASTSTVTHHVFEVTGASTMSHTSNIIATLSNSKTQIPANDPTFGGGGYYPFVGVNGKFYMCYAHDAGGSKEMRALGIDMEDGSILFNNSYYSASTLNLNAVSGGGLTVGSKVTFANIIVTLSGGTWTFRLLLYQIDINSDSASTIVDTTIYTITNSAITAKSSEYGSQSLHEVHAQTYFLPSHNPNDQTGKVFVFILQPFEYRDPPASLRYLNKAIIGTIDLPNGSWNYLGEFEDLYTAFHVYQTQEIPLYGFGEIGQNVASRRFGISSINGYKIFAGDEQDSFGSSTHKGVIRSINDGSYVADLEIPSGWNGTFRNAAQRLDDIDNTLYTSMQRTSSIFTLVGHSPTDGSVVKDFDSLDDGSVSLVGDSFSAGQLSVFSNMIISHDQNSIYRFHKFFDYPYENYEGTEETNSYKIIKYDPTISGGWQSLRITTIPVNIDTSKNIPILAYDGAHVPGGSVGYLLASDDEINWTFWSLGINTVVPDAKALDVITVESGFNRYMAVAQPLQDDGFGNSSIKIFNAFDVGINNVELYSTLEDYITFSGPIQHMEFSNVGYNNTPHMFVAISGAMSSGRFWQRLQDTSTWEDYTTNLPNSEITIVRLDNLI